MHCVTPYPNAVDIYPCIEINWTEDSSIQGKTTAHPDYLLPENMRKFIKCGLNATYFEQTCTTVHETAICPCKLEQKRSATHQCTLHKLTLLLVFPEKSLHSNVFKWVMNHQFADLFRKHTHEKDRKTCGTYRLLLNLSMGSLQKIENSSGNKSQDLRVPQN